VDEIQGQAWHSLPVDEVVKALATDAQGLAAADARARLERHGANALPPPPRPSALARFARQFNNVLIHVLLAAGALTAWMGYMADTAVIFGVVLVNALIGFIQEGKAEQAMRAIGALVAPRARVIRDGCAQTVDAVDLVPGDLVKLKPGDRVPADLRLAEVHGLLIDEAALTGESLPVSKHTDAVDALAALGDRSGMAWSGSLVARGEGRGYVVETGADTEIGRITGMLGRVHSLMTPLLREIARFGRWLTLIIMVAAVLLLLIGWGLHRAAAADTFLAAVAFAVAAIPEGLPAIITITLAVGVRRMAERRAIVRRLPAVETLGAVSVICSDKTGTLTRNELKVTHVVLDGTVRHLSRDEAGEDLHALAEAAVLCSEDESGQAADPLEAALLAFAATQKLDVAALRRQSPRQALLPFASENKLMATRHGECVYIKGAPERLLDRSCFEGRRARQQWEAAIADMAAEGLRVLALASRAAAGESGSLTMEAVGEGYEMLGLVGFADPPREEVADAIAACRSAGIAVKMITGDHAETALAIAAEIGMDTAAGALTGPELDALDDARLRQRALAVNVFARTSPENKLRLVEALQAGGQVVAMTGDGVNDAPALKRADIGVAMGRKGTEAAREAAEMVLADDHFATIVAGVEEGRGVYDNIRKSLTFILPTNAAQGLVVLLAVLAGLSLPLTPVQILWVNMVTAVTLALALAFEPLEGDIMRRRPRGQGGIVTRYMLVRITWVSVLITLATFAMYLLELGWGSSQAEARTTALNVLVLCEITYLFSARRWLEPTWHWAVLVSNRWALLATAALLILQLGITYLPFANLVFGTAPIGLREWLWAGTLALLLYLIVESEKGVLRAMRRSGAAP
jgi:calcium-translocating P-type ATPase